MNASKRAVRTAVGALISATTAIGLAACTPDDGADTPEAAPASQPTSAAPSPTPEPTESEEPANPDVEQARQIIEDYIRAGDAIGLDETYPREDLKKVAYGGALLRLENKHTMFSGPDMEQVGRAVIESIEVTETHIDEDPAYILFRVCTDNNGVDVLNASGESVMEPSGLSAYDYFVGNDENTDGKWLVSAVSYLEDETC